MNELLIVICVLALFLIGFFLVKLIDRFTEKNRKAISRQSEIVQPSCVMLTDDLSDEQIADEIRTFRQHHAETKIILLDSSGGQLSDAISEKLSS